MSLALWEFFWDWDGGAPAPTPAPTPSPAPTPPPNPYPPAPMPGPPTDSGGGGGKGKGKGHDKQHLASPQDLWDVREAYLRSIQPELPPAPKPEDYEAEANAKYLARQQELEQANSDRSTALIAMQAATDIKTLKSHGAKVKELTAKIATLTAKQSFARFMK